jgi:hypothetical protein
VRCLDALAIYPSVHKQQHWSRCSSHALTQLIVVMLPITRACVRFAWSGRCSFTLLSSLVGQKP